MHMARLAVTLFILAVSPCYPQFLDALLAQVNQFQGGGQNGGTVEGPCIAPTTTPEPTTTPTPTTTTTTSTSSTTPSPSQRLIDIFSRLPFFIQRRLIDSLGRFEGILTTTTPENPGEISSSPNNNMAGNQQNNNNMQSLGGNIVRPINPVKPGTAAQRNRLMLNPGLLKILRANQLRRRQLLQPNRMQARGSTGANIYDPRLRMNQNYLRRPVQTGNIRGASIQAVTTPQVTTTTTMTTAAPSPGPFMDAMYDPFYLGGYLHEAPQNYAPVRRKRQGGWGFDFPTMAPPDPASCTCQTQAEVMTDPEYTIHPTHYCNSGLECACPVMMK